MVKSTLTDYGNLVTQKTFEKLRDKAAATKINAYKKTTHRIPVHIDHYIDGGKFVQVPRGICNVGFVTRDEPGELSRRLGMPELMSYQEEIVTHVSATLAEKSCFYLQMDTGLGKSYVAAGLIATMNVKTCIIVANKSLCKQMHGDMLKAIPSVRVVKYDSANDKGIAVTSGKKKVYVPDCDVLIIVINTAAKMHPSFFNHFGLVIYDEVHAYCTDTFSAVFFKADTARYTFGMTATPSRIDGMESVSFLHLGTPVEAASISADEEMDAGNFHGTFHAVHYTGPVEFTKVIKSSAGVPSPILMANQFLSDPFRLMLAAMIVIDAYNAGRYVYIFCQTRDPLDILRRRIINVAPDEFRDLLKKQLFIVTGKSKEEESDMANKDARIFLTTYMLSSKGLSNRRFDTLLLLTPMKSNMMQITGRIFRKKSDEGRRRLIIDLVDDRTFMSKQHSKRVKDTASRNLVQKKSSVSYKDIGIQTSIRNLLRDVDAYNIYGDDDVGFDGWSEERINGFIDVYGDIPRENQERTVWPIIPVEKIKEYILSYMSEDEDDEDEDDTGKNRRSYDEED
jgi:hypothetical protein